jgi:hypothetical protein
MNSKIFQTSHVIPANVYDDFVVCPISDEIKQFYVLNSTFRQLFIVFLRNTKILAILTLILTGANIFVFPEEDNKQLSKHRIKYKKLFYFIGD